MGWMEEWSDELTGFLWWLHFYLFYTYNVWKSNSFEVLDIDPTEFCDPGLSPLCVPVMDLKHVHCVPHLSHSDCWRQTQKVSGCNWSEDEWMSSDFCFIYCVLRWLLVWTGAVYKLNRTVLTEVVLLIYIFKSDCNARVEPVQFVKIIFMTSRWCKQPEATVTYITAIHSADASKHRVDPDENYLLALVCSCLCWRKWERRDKPNPESNKLISAMDDREFNFHETT